MDENTSAESVTSIAERYFDGELAPPMRAAGMSEDGVRVLRGKYPTDAAANEAAVDELRQWARENPPRA